MSRLFEVFLSQLYPRGAAMATPDEIVDQQKLLHAHRRTLHYCLRQQAALGMLTPPGVMACIDEARDHIHRIKTVLRTWDIEVDDAPDDEPPTTSNDHKASTSALKVSHTLSLSPTISEHRGRPAH